MEVGDEAGIVDKDVEVAKLVAVGTGVSEGSTTKALQDVNAMTKTQRTIVLLAVFTLSLGLILE